MREETITLGAGCFWCVEAIFEQLKGVRAVRSGYSGGDIVNPSYKEVCTGRTGHAEVVQVHFDPDVISLNEILTVFWQVHDPTTLNRQGADVGTQYRSAIFFENDEQKQLAEISKIALDNSGIYPHSSVTEISKLKNFFPAEDYHNDYYNLNKEQPYCRAVIRPKMDKFQSAFSELLKSE